MYTRFINVDVEITYITNFEIKRTIMAHIVKAVFSPTKPQSDIPTPDSRLRVSCGAIPTS